MHVSSLPGADRFALPVGESVKIVAKYQKESLLLSLFVPIVCTALEPRNRLSMYLVCVVSERLDDSLC